MQRSGAITPRRAAWARSKREVCVGKRSVTWRAISAPVAVMPTKTGPAQRADRGRGLLAERRVRLVADDDRVGVGDLAGVADEPLVGLDRDRAVGRVLALQQRRADPVAVAAVAQLADELVDEVAAVGQDQDAAGPRRLDEPERGDRLAGAGGVLEPEAAVGVGVLGLPSTSTSSSSPSSSCQSWGSSSSGSLVVVLESPRRRRRPSSAARSPGIVGRASAAGSGAAAARSPFAIRRSRCRCSRWASASSAVSVPDSASTWWAERTVPSTSCGSSSESSRSSPSSSENSPPPLDRRLLGAGLDLAQRGVERATARGTGREGVVERLTFIDEALTREQLRARDRGRTWKRGGITHRFERLRLDMRAAAPRRGGSGGHGCDRPARASSESGCPLAFPMVEDSPH